MLKLIKKVVFALFLGLLTSCASQDEEKKEIALVPVDMKVDNSLVFLSRNSTAINAEGIIYLYKKDKELYLRSNKKNILIDGNVLSQRHSWLSVSGAYVYVYWWEKFGRSLGDEPKKLDKTVYVRASSDNGKTFGEKKILNSENGRPLAKLSIVSDDKGNASVFYLDERFAGYQVFVNTTHDGGKTWSKDLMLNDVAVPLTDSIKNTTNRKYFAVSPSINKAGTEIVAIWQEAGKEGEQYVNRIFSRVSLDEGKSWREKEEIYIDKGNYSLQIKTFYKDERLFLAVTQAGKGLFVLYKNEGSKWVGPSMLAPGTDKAKSASYIAMDADNQYLYLTYIHVPPNGGKKDWSTILQRYNVQKQTWEDDLHHFDAVFGLSKTRGGYQDITVLDDGTVMAVWEDYRYILPVILMAYSQDQGESWSSPTFLLKSVNHSVQKFPFIMNSKNIAQIFFEYSDLKEGGIPYSSTKKIRLNSPNNPKFKAMNLKEAVIISDDDRKKKLLKRFDELMKARVSKNWDKAWGYLDPVYRNLYSKKSWISSRDRIEYVGYEVLSTEVEGSEGKLSAIISFHIGNIVQGVTGDAKHLKNKKKSTEMPWGWFGDDWYLIAEDPRAPYMP